jgi:hypothetical protein
MAIFCCFYLIK